VLLIYATTLFVSALLLFLVQPMVGKMILPALGGTPAVWNTCMVFFQALLLAGYAYAHGAVRIFGVRGQSAVHLGLLLLPIVLSVTGLLVVLPIAIDTSGVPTSVDNPVGWLLIRLLIGVGLPFFVVSSNAPVLQMWFSRTGHSASADPYFLYSASNAGSLLALLGYPLVVERLLAVDRQSGLWYAGYGLLCGLALVCAGLLWRAPRSTADVPAPEIDDGRPVTGWRRLRWIALAFVPSSLMLGATTHITTDIAPVPLLWVVPLALYLLSFVIVFARRPIISHGRVLMFFPMVLALVAVMTIQGAASLGWIPVVLHLVMLLAAALACHGEMAADRPAARHLTEFFLWMSVGGVLGGLFNAVVAPLVFDTLIEYPLVMVVAGLVLVRRRDPNTAGNRALDFAIAVGIGLVVAGFLLLLRYGIKLSTPPLILTILVPAALCIAVEQIWPRTLRFGLSVGAAMIAIVACSRLDSSRMLYEGRNFYGMKSAYAHPSGSYHEFAHGTTVHGAQWTDPKGQDTPLTYFHPTGPVGNVFRVYESMRVKQNVGIIGLGAGAMAPYAQPGQHFTFYEIDPEVARIASDPALFTYLERCGEKCDIVLGDGRLTLAAAPDAHYGLLFLDAFSSDAVPVHLLTREALELYLRKLDPDGLLIFNITNRYLDLAPLLASLAEETGLSCRVRRDDANVPGVSQFPLKKASRFFVMSRNARALARLERFPDWEKPDAGRTIRPWTDQYSNIFSVLDWE
jgi:hypothetical protein